MDLEGTSSMPRCRNLLRTSAPLVAIAVTTHDIYLHARWRVQHVLWPTVPLSVQLIDQRMGKPKAACRDRLQNRALLDVGKKTGGTNAGFWTQLVREYREKQLSSCIRETAV